MAQYCRFVEKTEKNDFNGSWENCDAMSLMKFGKGASVKEFWDKNSYLKVQKKLVN